MACQEAKLALGTRLPQDAEAIDFDRRYCNVAFAKGLGLTVRKKLVIYPGHIPFAWDRVPIRDCVSGFDHVCTTVAVRLILPHQLHLLFGCSLMGTAVTTKPELIALREATVVLKTHDLTITYIYCVCHETMQSKNDCWTMHMNQRRVMK
ncbi:unnamed protein product [Cercospora beticola]|nr:unnamed protein product [Cercospora beticola]